jgi:hypothetical protein
MKKTTNHNAFVLNHLIDHGYITPAIAQQYRVTRLAARIFDLRNQPEPVNVYSELRYDDLGQRYTHYFIDDLERETQRGLRRVRAQWSERHALAAA